MGNAAFNVAKGRAIELVNRVKVGDPSASRLYAIPVDRAAVSDATLIDCDDFAAVITAGVTERNANGWSRITLAAADITAVAPDDTNDRQAGDTIDLSWAGPTGGTGNQVTDVVFCYAAVASPTNAQLVPLSIHTFAITPDGSAVSATVTDFYRAT